MPDRTYSLIIPIYALDKDRERAFRFVLSKALAYSVFSEVIIVEQLNDGQTPLDLPEGVTRVNYRTDLEESHKSKLVNLGAMQATGDVLFVNDCDIWLDWRTATKELNKLEMFAYCKPFSHFVRLDQQDADRLIETNLAANRGTTITVPIAGSFAIMRSLFLLIGGMDERFTGWAQEDTELRARLGKWFPITVLDRLVGRHLYHDRDSTTIRAHARQYSHIFAQSATGTFLGNLRKVETSIPKPAQRPLDDTAYVVCHYGTANELRNTATRESLEWLTYSQDELPRLIFAELTCGTEPQYADFADNPHIDYIHIQGDDSNSDLMQKEAIYNHVLANHSKGEKVWIFGDSDILPIDSDWIAETRRKVLENPRAIVHGYSVWRDQEQERLQISIARFKTDKPRDYPAPGLVWATHADYIEEFTEGGRPFFNPYLLTGSGDVMFIFEHGRREDYGNYNDRHLSYRWVQRIIDLDGPKADMDYVDRSLFHYYHGDYKGRAYIWSRVFLDYFGDVRQYVKLDGQGLLSWRDAEGSPLRKVLKRKSQLQDEESTKRVIRETMEVG